MNDMMVEYFVIFVYYTATFTILITIDLEAIHNEEVQIFMDNFNIYSLYN